MRVKRREKSSKVRRSIGRSHSASRNSTPTKINTTSFKHSSHQKSKVMAKRLRRKMRKKTHKRAAARLVTTSEVQPTTKWISNSKARLTNADDVPTTSAQAAAVTKAASVDAVTDKPVAKLKKFLDNATKYHVPSRKYLHRLKRLNSSNTSTASQRATRKLLKSIRKRQNQKFFNNKTPRKTVYDLRRQLNFCNENCLSKTPQGKANVREETLEEGEIVSDNDASKRNAENADDAIESAIDVARNIADNDGGEDDDDVDDDDESDIDEDCVCIEPQVELITIDDETVTAMSTAHEILPKQAQIITSTPHDKIKSVIANFVSATGSSETKSDVIKIDYDAPLLFFKDTSSSSKWLETITSEDTFADYTKLTTLRGGKKKKRRRSQRLREMAEGDSLIIDVTRTNDDVIFLDESTLKPMQWEPKESRTSRKKRNNTDDSVIFVSESNPNALPIYIPLEADDVPNPIRLNPTPKTPKSKRPCNDLFTRSEKKQLTEYNDNAYNPSAGDQPASAGKRMVIIDGSNVAFNHALNKEFSVKGLKICLEFFEKMGHDVKAVVPQFRLNKYKSSDPDELVILHRAGKIVFTPCKNLPGAKSSCYDDRFVLQLACELDAAIVSNDNYRDLINENSAFKKIIENRVVGYTWCNDIFILPKDPYGKWGPGLHTILNRK